MKKPECLHIPTLFEGENAEISWGVAEQDTNYILERVFNETFSQALSGFTWDHIDTCAKSWSKYDQDALNWGQIETRTGKGRHWERLDYEQLDWSGIEDQSQTWKQLESQEISFEIFRGTGTERIGFDKGRTWLEFKEQDQTWQSLDLAGYTWDQAESVILPGLSWENIEARWQTFEGWEDLDLTFHEMDSQKPEDKHQGMTDVIPVGATNAMYRLKAYGSDGEMSDCLTTSQLPVVPVFYRNGTVEYPVQAGKRYLVLMRAREVTGLSKIPMTLRYNPHLLQLTDFAAGSFKKVTKPGTYPQEQLIIYSTTPGKVWFQSTRQSEPDECFSGGITAVEFIAGGTGTAAVSLS